MNVKKISEVLVPRWSLKNVGRNKMALLHLKYVLCIMKIKLENL